MVNNKDISTEEKILEAARKVFITKGLSGARMQDIANGAGINKALLHYYFRSKDKLFETIFQEASQQFIPRINEILQSELSVFQKIETFCGEYISKILETPFIPLFIINEMNKHPHSFLQRMWGKNKPDLTKFVQQLEAEIKKGNIKKISPVHLIMHMMSLCIFPFIGKPIWQYVMEMDDLQFRNMMEQRKKEVPRFIIESIRN
ncbi:MAG: TetR/AcrR family transcriptional regulator [Flavisolibacter sp.]|nr:TetR/AcrR family transcriptional regulator [Flavisolibacter sp.]MBD0366626.1 TetR/AcrR family transcriptional regulator [Flavisolibacter sp.]